MAEAPQWKGCFGRGAVPAPGAQGHLPRGELEAPAGASFADGPDRAMPQHAATVAATKVPTERSTPRLFWSDLEVEKC